MSTEFTFKRALSYAVLMHVALFVVLAFRLDFDSKPSKKPLIVQAPPIEAVAVTDKELDAEIKRIENIEKQKQAKAEAERQRIAEEKRKAEAEQKRLADQKRQMELEAKKLAEQKQKAEAEAKKLAEQKKQAEAEAKKLAEQKQKAEAEAKKLAEQKKQAEAKKLADEKAAREKALADQLAKEAREREARVQAENMREIDRYKALVQQQIMRHWLVTPGLNKQAATKLAVRVAPSGTVIDVKITQSSGNDAMDRSAVAAVYKASPLPVPQNPDLFNSFRELKLTLRPDSILEG